MNCQTPVIKSAGGTTSTKSKKTRSSHKKTNPLTTASFAANGSERKPEAEDLVAAVAAAVAAGRNVKLDEYVDRQFTTSRSIPSRRSRQANPNSSTKAGKVKAAAATLSQAAATTEEYPATKDSLHSLMNGGECSVLDNEGAIHATEPPVVMSPPPLTTPTSSGAHVALVAPKPTSPATDLTVSSECVPGSEVEGGRARHDQEPEKDREDAVARVGAHPVDSAPPPPSDLLSGAPVLAGTPSLEDDTWGTKSLMDNTSVLSETDALTLEDPIVAVSRSMSVETPMDTYAEALAKGIECEVHGLVIPYGWTWCLDGPILQAYTALTDEIYALEADVDPAGRCCYVYPPSELHCTVATLSSFKETDSYFATLGLVRGRSTDEARNIRREVMELWKGAVERQFTALPSPSLASVERIEVCESATIFHLQPLDDALERMRVAVRTAAEDTSFREYEINNGLSPYELTRLIHIPKISHSTFVRFRKRPSPQLRSRLQEVVTRWTPHRVEMHGMNLVYENRPYMHVDMERTVIMKIEGMAGPPPALTSEEAPLALEKSALKVTVSATACEQCPAPVRSALPAATTATVTNTIPITTAHSNNAAPPVSSWNKTTPPNNDDSSSGWSMVLTGIVVLGIVGVVAVGMARRK